MELFCTMIVLFLSFFRFPSLYSCALQGGQSTESNAENGRLDANQENSNASKDLLADEIDDTCCISKNVIRHSPGEAIEKECSSDDASGFDESRLPKKVKSLIEGKVEEHYFSEATYGESTSNFFSTVLICLLSLLAF